MRARQNKIGMTLFGVYLLLYVGFVFLNAFAAETMEATPLPGVNLAILYGFGLIVMAFVLALVYGFLCRDTGEAEVGEETKDDL